MVFIPAMVAVTSVAAPGQSGTTISATKTVFAHWTRTYQWTIEKSVDPDVWDLTQGGSWISTYTITVTQTGYTDTYTLSGEICVTNGGDVATQSLAITDDLQINPNTPLSTGVPVDVSAKPILAPGESYCYAYSQTFNGAPVAGTYKNTAHVTIMNHSGHLGTPYGPSPSATTTMPNSPDIVNDVVHVDDTNGYEWTFSASGSETYTKTFTCADVGENTNTATIQETGQYSEATVTVTCQAGACTRTIGYWKNHDGSGPQPDLITQYLPIWLGTSGGAKSVQVTTASQASTILGIPDASNGIDKLYAQLLAAKLNIAAGADGSTVASTITAADTFLATHNSADWSTLTPSDQTTVLSWKTALDNYNNSLEC
jgi:hypothetical protein